MPPTSHINCCGRALTSLRGCEIRTPFLFAHDQPRMPGFENPGSSETAETMASMGRHGKPATYHDFQFPAFLSYE